MRDGTIGKRSTTKATLTLCATALWLIALAPSAFAAPTHARKASLDVSGLNHACGAAVDSKGDVYASSAGESKVKVFDTADHATPIAEIANANEPCALAVTTAGDLYVSERATGNVVRYKPDAFPLTGAPVYGPAEPIDTSGDAEGIAVDRFDNRLYVAGGDHVAVYKADGTFEADILTGELTEATGVAAYTNPNSLGGNRRLNLAVAEGAGDELKLYSGPASPPSLKLRKTVTGVDHDEDPGTAEQEFSFGAAGAYLAADPGNENTPTQGCVQVQVGGLDQACTQGHFFLHDAGNGAIDEFDATGEPFARITAAGLSADALPSQVAVERSGGASDGTLYAGSGSGAGAGLLAFAPVLKPSRASLGAPFSKVLAGARAVATDCKGYVYVAAGVTVRAYSPAGAEVASFEEANAPSDLAADCAGNVYVVDTTGTPQATYYSPSSYPPTGSTTYTRHTPSLVTSAGLVGVAVNPANGHAFVAGNSSFAPVIKEFGPPSGGSKEEGVCGAGLELANARLDIDVYGKTGNVYVTANLSAGIFYVLKCGKEAKDAELVREVKDGGGCSSGKMGASPRIAVDQSNGHFVEYANNQLGAAAREYDAVGGCVAEFGTFSSQGGAVFRVAIDNSCALNGLTEETTPTCAATYPSSGNAYVAYDAANNEVQPFDVTAFGDVAYPEAPPLPKFKLTVKKSGTGTGKVTSSPPGIDCGSDCNEEYEEGEEVTLSATSDGGSTFAGWSGAGCSGTGTCKVTMSAAKEVTATFDLESTPEFTLSITNAGTGTGTVKCKVGAGSPGACAAKYPEGTQLSLIAEAAAGSEFASYSSGTGSAAACTISPCNFTLNANSSVTATFNLIPRTLSITSAGTGTGEVKCKFNGGAAGACTSPQPNGTTVEIIATANSGSEFAGFSSGTGSASSCLTSPCSFTITANSSVTATFNLIPRTLSITSAGTGTGEVKCKFNGGSAGACTSPQPNGTSVEIIATANSGSTFAGFSSGTGSASSCSISPCSFTITANSSVTASFNEESTTPEFLLTVDTEGTGSGTVTSDKGTISCDPFCTDEYAEGTVVVLTATPAPGSVFYSWKYCDKGGVNGRQCTMTVDKAKTVKAVFTTTYDLEVSRAGSGLGKVQSSPGGILCLSNCSETTAAFKEATKVTLKQTPAKHFHFVKWLGDCTGSGACEPTMGEDHSVQAEFAEDPKHLLTLTKSGGGQGTVKSSVAGINCGLTCSEQASAYFQGEVVELTATPGKGSAFGGWSGGGCSGTGICTVTMSAAKAVQAEFK